MRDFRSARSSPYFGLFPLPAFGDGSGASFRIVAPWVRSRHWLIVPTEIRDGVAVSVGCPSRNLV